MGNDEHRLDQHEERLGDLERQQAELVVVVMGPGPSHSNGIRGELKSLKTAFYEYKDARIQEDTTLKTAGISMRGVVLAATIPASISAIVTIMVAILK